MENIEIDKEWIEYYKMQGLEEKAVIATAETMTKITRIKAQELANEIDREIIADLEKQT